MFCLDKNNKIKLTKGDNAELEIRVYEDSGQERGIYDDDVVTLTVRKNAGSEESALVKNAVQGVISFVPEDTKNLLAGTYIYDVELQTFTGKIYTIIPLSFFELCEEVTR